MRLNEAVLLGIKGAGAPGQVTRGYLSEQFMKKTVLWSKYFPSSGWLGES